MLLSLNTFFLDILILNKAVLLCGIMLILTFTGQKIERKAKKIKSPTKSQKAKESDHLMTDAEHDSLRTGIQSIMTQMDEMLSGMKQSKKK